MPSKAVKKTAPEAPSIESLRARLDEVSVKILRMLNLRASIASEIGRLKHTDGTLVYQPGREREVIERLIAENQGPLTSEHIDHIYTEIISACRGLEQTPRVAFLGPAHTYSHEASRARFGASVDFVPLPSFAAVFQAIENGRADFGVVPVENTTEGQVGLTLDLLIDTPLVIIGEIMQPVRHALLSRDGDRSKIRRILSHQQSLGQCRNFLSTDFPQVETEAVVSNALAAQRAAEDPSLGAIASRAAGAAYGLRVIAENIQDIASNTTRFLVMAAKPVDRTARDKTTALFAVADRVGALNQALGVFARNGINISKIESRPMRSRPWEYLFFVDLAGNRDDPKLKRALDALSRKALFLKVLGSYPEGRPASA